MKFRDYLDIFGKRMKKKAFPKFGKRKGMKKPIPKIREQERNEKIPFPHFGNGNQRLSFPGIPGNRNGKNKQKSMTI